MNTLYQIRELFLKHWLTLLAALVLAAALAGNVIFYTTNIAPALTVRDQMNIQVRDARDALVETRRLQNEPPATIQARVSSAQSKLASVISPLASITQTNLFIDALYHYGDESHIMIVNLQTEATILQPTPTPVPAATLTRSIPTLIPRSGTGTSGGATPVAGAATSTRTIPPTLSPTRATPTPAPTLAPEQDAFYIKIIRIQATGTFHQLNDFLSRIKEFNSKAVALNSVEISGAESRAALNLELALYVSSTAAGNTPIGAPTPTNTALPAPTQPPAQQPPAPPPPPQPSATPVPPSTATPIPATLTATATITPTPTASLTATPSQRTTIYTVQPGDTLFSIARRFNTTLEAIAEANHLPSTFIRPGQQLFIPIR